MDNQFSQVTIEIPTVPADFDATAGNTKRDFAVALLDLVSKAQLLGINLEQPNNFDLATIQSRLTTIENTANSSKLKQRTIRISGIDSGALVVPFDDIGTTNYWVNLIVIVPSAALANTVTWALLDNSKQTNQCTLHIKGTGSIYTFEIHILEIKS